MPETAQISHVRRGSDGPFDAAGVRRTDAGMPYYASLPPSLGAAWRRVVAANPSAEAVVEVGGDRLTYGELWDRAGAIAGGLRVAGIKPADRVALDLPNGVEWIACLLGILLAGGIAVPVNTRLSGDERAGVLDGSGAALVIDATHPAPRGSSRAYDQAGPTTVAAIFYTSGTTGRSKGAISTHEALLAVSENVLRSVGIPRDLGGELRTLVCVPLFHVTGFAAQMVTTLLCGGTLVILNGLDAERMLQTIVDERVSLMIAVPAIYFYLLASRHFSTEAVKGVRWALYGGAPITPDLVKRLMDSMPATRVANGFGMSETSSMATLLPHEDSDTHADSIGFPCPCIDVAVLDPDPLTGVGELLARGQSVTPGYWDDPAQSSAAFVDGWLRTGDIGRIDGDGRLYLVDRLKDMINRGGENVYSVEVENALADAPGVNEVAVVAVPDTMMGEKVGCVIVPSHAEIEVKRVLEHAATRIADYKIPQFVAVRHEPLPRNAAGKVLKHLLRDETEWGTPVR
jgi:acyl-CoA synthetase (AMP-forming)/AMP-acid ligase II